MIYNVNPVFISQNAPKHVKCIIHLSNNYGVKQCKLSHWHSRNVLFCGLGDTIRRLILLSNQHLIRAKHIPERLMGVTAAQVWQKKQQLLYSRPQTANPVVFNEDCQENGIGKL